MSKQYFEDFPVGRVMEFGDYHLTEEMITQFRAQFDEASGASGTERTASAWHMSAITSRLACDGILLNSSSVGGPGVGRFDYLRPARAGDRLWSRTSVLTARPSRTKPHLGFVDFRFEVLRDREETVSVMDGGVIFLVRQPAEAQTQPKAGRSSDRESAPDPAVADPQLLRDSATVEPGMRFTLGDHTFKREDVLAFASQFDPQSFHLDDGAASRTHFARLAASGWHTAAALSLRLATTRGFSVPVSDFKDLVWTRPVHADDTLTYSATVLEKTVDADSGSVRLTLDCSAVNQDGHMVFRVALNETWRT